MRRYLRVLSTSRRIIKNNSPNFLKPLSTSRTCNDYTALASAAVAGLVLYSTSTYAEKDAVTPGLVVDGLPTYTLAQVSKITSESEKTLVVYKNGVYDITSFISSHPGGVKQISLASGASIEPYWALYAAHHHPEVYKILESYRVGNIDPADVLPNPNVSSTPLYAYEPKRHPALVVNSSEPFNAEPPSALLMTDFITPNDIFFVRNHLPVPTIDITKYKLEIQSRTGVSQLSLEELKTKFKSVDVTTTIQCAGNRRAEMSCVKSVKGLSWDKSAIGTATWTGVRLSDVLASLDVKESLENRHIHFEGLDLSADGKTGYGASIPIATALDPRKDVILAYQMNGVEIPRDHGYPLRVIVPGTVGARNVKFLSKISVSDVESSSFWQQRDYKGFPPGIDYNSSFYWKRAGPSIQELPVQSAILEPSDGYVLTEDDKNDGLVIRGYAWSGGGRGIVRVDVTLDGGKTWREADLHEDGLKQDYNRAWAWTPWVLIVDDFTKEEQEAAVLDIRCKAVDSSYNSQPDTIAPIWNMRGVLNNAWHCIEIVNKQDR